MTEQVCDNTAPHEPHPWTDWSQTLDGTFGDRPPTDHACPGVPVPYRPTKRDLWAAYVVDAAMLLLSRRTREIVQKATKEAMVRAMRETKRARPLGPALRVRKRR